MNLKLAVFLTVSVTVLALFLLVKSPPIPVTHSNFLVLTEDNTISLSGEIGSEESTKAILQGRTLDQRSTIDNIKKHVGLKTHEPLYIFMNTPGGSVRAGQELIEAFHGLNHPVKTVTLFAASMGFQIVQGLDERLVLENGILMSHRAAGGVEGTLGGQSPSQFENRYSLWYDILKKLDLQTVKRTNGKQTLESYQKAYADEMWRLGQRAVDEGYADRVVTVRCDDSLKGVDVKHVTFFGFDISYEVDKCPINTGIMNVKVTAPMFGDNANETDDADKGKEKSKGKKHKGKDKDKSKDEKKGSAEETYYPDPQELQDVKDKFIEDYNHKMKTPVVPYW
jgi:ATP-dependent protease ClpP protease subunit